MSRVSRKPDRRLTPGSAGRAVAHRPHQETLPLFHARSLRFALASCSNYPYGYFQVYRRIADTNVGNVVVLTGDIHSSWGSDLASNPFDAAQYDPATGGGSVGVELVTPGVTSPGIEDPVAAAQQAAGLRFLSPHMKFIELNKRGYVVVDINRDRMQSKWWHVPTIRERTDVQALAASLATESGANHLVPATAGLTAIGDAADPAPRAG